MTAVPSMLNDLLADCDAHGIRLLLTSDGGLTIDAPQDALTPDLMDRLKSHRADVLALLQPAPHAGPALNRRDKRRPSEAHEAGLPMRFDHLERRTNSWRTIHSARLRPV